MNTDVSNHYNNFVDHSRRRTLTSLGKVQRLKNCNSFMKAAMYHEFSDNPKVVLDLACGHGNDMHKFARLGVDEYFGCDISRKSIDEAQARSIKLRSMKTRFYCKDIMQEFTIRPGLSFDLIAMQFAIHYVTHDSDRLLALLSSVKEQLKPGSRFVVSTVDGDMIQKYTRGMSREWQNDICRIIPVSPNSYRFYLEDTIESCVEHLVRSDILINYAGSVGLKLILSQSYPDYYDQARVHQEMLHQRLHVSKFTDPEQEVFNLYRVFVFES